MIPLSVPGRARRLVRDWRGLRAGWAARPHSDLSIDNRTTTVHTDSYATDDPSAAYKDLIMTIDPWS